MCFIYPESHRVACAHTQLMEIVTEWPTEEFSQLLMGVLAADFLGSLALEALAGMIFPLPKGVL